MPTSLQWGESYILMYPHVVAGVCWGLSLGELMIPHLLNLFRCQFQSLTSNVPKKLDRFTSKNTVLVLICTTAKLFGIVVIVKVNEIDSSSEALTWLGFAMLGATFLCLGLFLCVFLMARKHESRYFKN